MSSVDVLAVMDRAIVFAERTGSAEDLANAREARAAVAELIEAAEDAQLSLAHLTQTTERGYSHEECEEHSARLFTALARVTGAQA